VILSHATQIANFYRKKREDMLWLWQHRELLHIYIRAHSQSKADQLRTGRTRNRDMYAGKAARGAVLQHLNSRALPVEFGRAINRLNRVDYGIQLMCITLESMILALECTDIATMWRYMVNVNSETYDSTVGSVGFIRNVPHNAFAEILLWRLLRSLQ